MTEVIFKGPNCKLKGLHYQDKNPQSPVVLVLYPESKSDTIPEAVKSVISLLLDNNFSVFAFNFKRINNPLADQNQKREAELFEVISALNWINEKHRESRILWVFSFFAACSTGLQVVMRRPEITDYILFSPPAKFRDLTFVVPCSSVGLIVYETNLPNSVDDIVEKLSNKSDSCIDTMPIDNANIEQNKNIQPMLEMIDEYIKKRLIEDTGKIRKIKRDRRRRKKKKNPLDEEKNLHVVPIKTLDLD